MLRVGEGEFDGEFDGNSREFDAGFGEFDVFQYACGAMNPSIGAMRGRGKVSFYKIKRGNRLAPAPGPGVSFRGMKEGMVGGLWCWGKYVGGRGW